MNLFLCLYQYSGMETEGHLQSEEKFICVAEEETAALFKYHCWLYFRNKKTISWKRLSQYRQFEYASGGWGYTAYKLDISMLKYRDDTNWFEQRYIQHIK